MRELLAIEFREGYKKLPIEALWLPQRSLLLHVDGLALHFTLALRRTNLHAQPAPRAILRRHLQRIAQGLEFPPAWFRGLECLRRVLQQRSIVDFGPNHRVRAYQHALSALDAKLLVPNRNFLRDVALLPHGCAGWKGSVNRHGADRERIPVSRHNRAQHIAYELRRARRNPRKHVK